MICAQVKLCSSQDKFSGIVGLQIYINPLPVQFKSLLHGQEGCVFFSGHLNVRKYHYALVRLGQQAEFKSTTL
jgi:hypothetical protein